MLISLIVFEVLLEIAFVVIKFEGLAYVLAVVIKWNMFLSFCLPVLCYSEVVLVEVFLNLISLLKRCEILLSL